MGAKKLNPLEQKAYKVFTDFKSGLSMQGKFVYVAIVSITGGEPQVIKYDDLMELTEIKSRPTIIKVVRELEEHGLIRTEKLKHSLKKFYVL